VNDWRVEDRLLREQGVQAGWVAIANQAMPNFKRVVCHYIPFLLGKTLNAKPSRERSESDWATS
jgi:hypothetical protein